MRSVRAYRDFLRDAGMKSSDVLTPSALRAMRRLVQDKKPAAKAAPTPAGALHRATKTGDLGRLGAALKTGSDVRGWTPLMYAVNKGYVLMVPPLLKAGADANLRAPDGATALFIAALHGNSQIVDQLLKAGANASIKGPKGRTAVDIATSNKDPDLVAMFLSPRANKPAGRLGRDFSPRAIDGNGWTDLHYAAALNLPVLAKLLLSGGADPNARLKSDGKPLAGRLTVHLREAGYSLTNWDKRYGQTPLKLVGGNYGIVKALVEGGADVNASGNYCCPPLYRILSNKKTEENTRVVKLLLANGADVNSPAGGNYGTMLHYASTASLMARLISLSADVSARNGDGMTPLHSAASFFTRGSRHLSLAQMLLDNGADVNARDNSGRTPLMFVSGKQGIEMHALLLKNGADAKAADKDGRTALYIAVDGGNTLVANLLVSHGADVNAPWYTTILGKRLPWYTPLHTAVLKANIDVVKVLVELGADVGAKTHAVPHLLRPITPRQYAEHLAGNRNWSDHSRQKVRRIAELLGGHSGGQEEPEEHHGR